VAGVDYTAVVNRTVTFLPGARTVNVPITIINNTILNGTRTVNLSLSGAVGAQLVPSRSTAVLSILDDEVGGTIQFSAATYTVGEGAGSAAIVLTRTGSTAGGATVHYATSDGTGAAPPGYMTTTGTAALRRRADLAYVPGAGRRPPAGGRRRTTNLMLSNPGPNLGLIPTTKARDALGAVFGSSTTICRWLFQRSQLHSA
jgi:hypothetical protein